MSKITIKTLTINNNPVPNGYKPNTLSYEPGFGEINVRTVVNGNSTTTVHAPDASTKIGMLKVELEPIDKTADNQDILKYIKSLKDNIGSNTLKVTSADTGVKRTFVNCSCTNKIEFVDGTDGNVSLEFKGDEVQL